MNMHWEEICSIKMSYYLRKITIFIHPVQATIAPLLRKMYNMICDNTLVIWSSGWAEER